MTTVGKARKDKKSQFCNRQFNDKFGYHRNNSSQQIISYNNIAQAAEGTLLHHKMSTHVSQVSLTDDCRTTIHVSPHHLNDKSSCRPIQSSSSDKRSGASPCHIPSGKNAYRAHMVDRASLRGGQMENMDQNCCIGTWNIEGYTEEKLISLQVMMLSHQLSVLCLQEVKRCKSEHFISDAGFLVILSGSSEEITEHAGVGFIIAPSARKSIIGFCPLSNRLCAIKLKMKGGKFAIISTYAPHSGHAFDIRQRHFHALADFWHSIRCNGPKIICGDLNARLYSRMPNEHAIIGEHAWLSEKKGIHAKMNRQLLMQICTQCDLQIANSFFRHLPEHQVTYFDIGYSAATPVSYHSHAQLDLILCPSSAMSLCTDVYSEPGIALKSHHFLMKSYFNMAIQPISHCNREARFSLDSLRNSDIVNNFTHQVAANLHADLSKAYSSNIDVAEHHMNESFKQAAETILPKVRAQARKPWISSRTLRYIDERNHARLLGNEVDEKSLTKLVKQSVKQDRTSWLHDALQNHDWKIIRKLKKGNIHSQGRIKNAEGIIVSSEERAETMAKHRENMQWHVRPDTKNDDRSIIFETMPIDLSDFTFDEIVRALRKLKRKKCPGHDDIPAEFWLACSDSKVILEWLQQFCNLSWKQKRVPDSWHKAKVACLYKKGDPAMPDNYRPISLLAIGYKLFASLLLQRLKDAGAEDRIFVTQFGFRSNFGTREALFLARRMIEHSWISKDHKFTMLALDWAKAFDAIAPESLMQALRRFGVPEEFVSMIRSIYTDRCFYIQDAYSQSEIHAQHFGISQGCPLSPFLFSILMTILMHDATAKMQQDFNIQLPPSLVCHAILYADDTLLLGINEEHLQKFMDCIAQLGSSYGLSLNWSKVESMPIQCECQIVDPSGNKIASKSVLKYLGANISADGQVDSEIAQKLGLAECDFKSLVTIWNHSSMTRQFKYQVFVACILQKLLYALDGAVLLKSHAKKLDAFHARCIRKILGISPAFISRVSNKFVLSKMNAEPLSQTIYQRQLDLLGKIYRLSDAHPLRKCIFKEGSIDLIDIEKRRVGRPRHAWGPMAKQMALKITRDQEHLKQIIRDKNTWQKYIRQHSSHLAVST